MSTVIEAPVRSCGFAVRRRSTPDPRLVVLILSGAGEARACEHVSDRLLEEGAVVYESEFDHVLSADVVGLVEGVREVRLQAVTEYPGLPVVVVGHSSGAVAATVYAGLYPEEVQGLVLAGLDPRGREAECGVADLRHGVGAAVA